jgi:hypothetical protein
MFNPLLVHRKNIPYSLQNKEKKRGQIRLYL